MSPSSKMASTTNEQREAHLSPISLPFEAGRETNHSPEHPRKKVGKWLTKVVRKVKVTGRARPR